MLPPKCQNIHALPALSISRQRRLRWTLHQRAGPQLCGPAQDILVLSAGYDGKQQAQEIPLWVVRRNNGG